MGNKIKISENGVLRFMGNQWLLSLESNKDVIFNSIDHLVKYINDKKINVLNKDILSIKYRKLIEV
jgi:hypothetical protein